METEKTGGHAADSLTHSSLCLRAARVFAGEADGAGGGGQGEDEGEGEGEGAGEHGKISQTRQVPANHAKHAKGRE